jgi:predicted CopG family antitoxin
MGRQHTIYLSDVTYAAMQSLKKEDESMSQVIRNALEICNANKETFDLVAYQEKKIEAYKRQIDALTKLLCHSCESFAHQMGLID